ncbi:hypothetical protein CRUP_020690 [Coryphaenoides rupestris]|nr:hypothetical protein CRUP_020690 [Coryphaenoides rupestris]
MTGDRPFQCTQCGVSFTQKGNLLRHIKLHTGEKPFKCPFCSYAYKQRTSLEEHKERCHSVLQTVPARRRWSVAEPGSMALFDRPPVIGGIQNNVGKRKSTNPQKFVGEKAMRYGYPEPGYELRLKYEKAAEAMQAHMMDQVINNPISYLGSDSLRPMGQHPGLPHSMTDVGPMVHHVLPLGLERPRSCSSLPLLPPQHPLPLLFPGHTSSNGQGTLLRHDKLQQQQAHRGVRDRSPSNGSGMDSDSARSSPQERAGFHGAGGGHSNNNNNPPSCSSAHASPSRAAFTGERAPEPARGFIAMSGGGASEVRHATAGGEEVHVFGREGREIRAFQCEHCHVLFLDHVMYTIHMGCHGYREPLECNICGHRSKDRYEFSSHIVRGKHTFQ